MVRSVNATPVKVYIVLFLFIIIGYVAFIIARSLKKSSSDMEHFEESGEGGEYKYRLEVMKVFDMYLSRNPTPDEITKYAELKNEQDILLAVLKDFNITAPADVEDKKKTKDETKQPAKETVVVPQVENLVRESEKEPFLSTGVTPEDMKFELDIPIDKLVREARKHVGIKEPWKEEDGGDLTVSRTAYADLQAKVNELQAAVMALDQTKKESVAIVA